jgi:hypothetical protein
MSVKVVFHDIGDVKVAEVSGNMETSTDADAVVDGTVRSFELKLLVNMRGVKKVEPAAVRQLKARRLIVESRGGEVRLLNIDRIRNPQTVVALGEDFPIHTDETEAIRSFR